MSHTAKLTLPFLAQGQAQKHVTVNEALLRIDALVQLGALSATDTTEPSAPADGDLYILPAGKTGAAWGPMANGAIAYYRDGIWEAIAPRIGWLAFITDSDAFAWWTGSAWESFAPGNGRVVGEVTAFAGASAPALWLFCYGQAVSRTTYAALFYALGTAHGAGDGTYTFNVPDLRGRAIFGRDDMGGSAAGRITSGVSGLVGATLGASGGDERLHQHAHAVTDPGHAHSVVGDIGNPGAGVGVSGSASTGGSYSGLVQSTSTGISIDNAGAGAAQNMPPALILNYVIYAGV